MTIYLKENNLQLFILHIKKDFTQKEIYFNKLRLVSKVKKKNDDKNMIFSKYRDKIYPFKLEITETYIANFSDATDK